MKYIAIAYPRRTCGIKAYYVSPDGESRESAIEHAREAIDEWEDPSVGLSMEWEWNHVRLVPLFTTLANSQEGGAA